MSFTSWSGLFLDILGGAILKGIFFFLQTHSYIALLVYRNATNFWMLILHPAILLNLLIRLSRFCVESLLRDSLHSIMSSEYNDNLNTSPLIWIHFISFSFLVAVARTSKNMLNRSDESGSLVLFQISPFLC